MTTPSYTVNQDALDDYRQVKQFNDWNNSYSLEDELHHSVDLNTSASSFNNSFSTESPHPTKSKYHGNDAPRKSLKDKSPLSVDRGLRVQTWVGNHTPHGFQKPRRSYKLKNPADEIYLSPKK